MIADGLQDVMVTGGSESTVSPIGIGGFNALKALSTRNEEPQRASRPFDKRSDTVNAALIRASVQAICTAQCPLAALHAMPSFVEDE